MPRRRTGGPGAPGTAIPGGDFRYSNGFRKRLRCIIPNEKLVGTGAINPLPLKLKIKNPHLKYSTDTADPNNAGFICSSSVYDIKLETLAGVDVPFRFLSFDDDAGTLELEAYFGSLTAGAGFAFYLYAGNPEQLTSLARPDLVAAPFIFYYQGSVNEVGGRTAYTLTAVDNSPATPTFRSGMPWRSGASVPTDNSLTQRADFEAYRNGHLLDTTTIYMGGNYFADYGTWTNNPVARSGGYANQLNNAGYTVCLSIPLLINSQARQFSDYNTAMANTSSTEYLAHQHVANLLHSWLGSNAIYLMIGWEANKGYSWSLSANGTPASAPNLAAYASAWARTAQVYKNILPGAKTVWSHLPDPEGGINVGLYDPNLAIAGTHDVFGLDYYDRAGRFGTLTLWNNNYGSYNSTTGNIQGIGGHLAYAVAKGLKLAFPEWAPTNLLYDKVTNPTPNPDGSNNGFFIPKVYDFFVANVANIEFENFYNKAGQHRIQPASTWLPLASAAYPPKWA